MHDVFHRQLIIVITIPMLIVVVPSDVGVPFVFAVVVVVVFDSVIAVDVSDYLRRKTMTTIRPVSDSVLCYYYSCSLSSTTTNLTWM